MRAPVPVIPPHCDRSRSAPGMTFWATPPCLTEALTEAVRLRKRPIWEFAAGDGRLAKALRGAGYTVIASDIEPRGEGIKRSDFLTDWKPVLRGR